MPEGDAVLRTARRLDAALRGAVLTRSDLRWPSLATRDLAGRTTVEVVARGKHLLHRVSGGVTLHSHLRMEGSWRVYAAPGPPLRDHRIRAVLGTGKQVAVGTSLGLLDLVPTEHEDRVVGHLGPDLLAPDWAAEPVVAALGADSRPLGEALLDQTVVAGLGTIWVSEALFFARLSPWLPAAEADPASVTGALANARTRMLASMAQGPPTARGGGLLVYGRPGRPCPRCRRPIGAGRIGPPTRERTLNHCPACQPGGGAAAPPRVLRRPRGPR